MNKTITLKLSKILAIIVSIGVLGAGGLLFYWSVQPSMVLTVNNAPVPAQPHEVNDGDKVNLTIDYCKSVGVTGISTVNLIGDQGAKIAVSWPLDTTPKQCAKLTDIPVPIPAQTPTDTYRVEFVECYTVNPLKSSCTTFTSTSFKVINMKLNPGDAKVQ